MSEAGTKGETKAHGQIFCAEHGAIRVEGSHCYEILLGSENFRRIIQDNAGTYFLEKELVINFEDYCRKPLELDDPEMKEMIFRRYEFLVYIRQPSDPDMTDAVNGIAGFLGLSVKCLEADYFFLEKAVLKLIGAVGEAE